MAKEIKQTVTYPLSLGEDGAQLMTSERRGSEEKTVAEKALFLSLSLFLLLFLRAGTSAHVRRLLLLLNKRALRAPSLRHVGPERAKVAMRIYRGADGRMPFTYAQLSPGGKEGSERERRQEGRRKATDEEKVQ